MQQHQPRFSPPYDEDFYAWTQHQAKLLRALRKSGADLPPEVDFAHVAEEIEDLGKAELRGVTSLIRQILVHLIKAASDPNSQARAHWRAEVVAFQADIPGYYTPSMRQLIDLDSIWGRALKMAEASLQDSGSALARNLPSECPCSIDELLSDDFDFDGTLRKLAAAKA